MQSHQWIFSLFPNRTYVSVRRNLPHYDYPEFVRTVSRRLYIKYYGASVLFTLALSTATKNGMIM